MAHASGNPTWQDFPSTATPITAAALEHIETALDREVAPPFGHAGRTAGFQNVSAGGEVGVTAQVLSGGMTASGNALVVPTDGLYLITGKAYATGGSGIRWSTAFRLNSDVWALSPSAVAWKGDAGDYSENASGVRALAAGDRISMSIAVPGHSTWGTDGYNGSWFEVLYVGASTTPPAA